MFYWVLQIYCEGSTNINYLTRTVSIYTFSKNVGKNTEYNTGTVILQSTFDFFTKENKKAALSTKYHIHATFTMQQKMGYYNFFSFYN